MFLFGFVVSLGYVQQSMLITQETGLHGCCQYNFINVNNHCRFTCFQVRTDKYFKTYVLRCDTFKNLAVYVELTRKPLQCVCGLLHGRCLWYFSFMGFYPFDLQAVGLQLAAVALAATLVESLPITNRLDDNLTVPLTTIILGLFLFPVKSTMTPLP